ncbi:uncharacterized protein FPRO_07153 [Fusarium proliferatum ET1]|uniref:JmjC domain-containing protein n=1 Tax=Fusarium proliferatum (strain ET1) TaxID=1227346 RepID=A0A1L7VD60_FUSPR|nr:uncharacterized protein FPRO_07153 [Fusarium proliferatum ET1]CZR37656.1 uncharacterized protein FPRO_07153 [Fusarium proliferatum ET1]
MSTSNPPMPKQDSLVERLEEFSSGFSALYCALAFDLSQIECQSSRETRSQSKTPTETQSTEQIAKQREKSAYNILRAVFQDLDSLKVQLEAITNDVEARDTINEQVIKEATSGLQMGTLSDTGEVAATTPIGSPEQETSSQSQASGAPSPTSDDQPTMGSEDVAVQPEGVGEAVDTQVQPEASTDMSEGQQAVESEDVIMGESESADGSPSHSLEGNDDDTAHHTTPEPTTPRLSQWVSLNTRPWSSSTGSGKAVSESLASAVDSSPAGSVTTHITWPDSSTGACEQDTPMSGAEGTDDDQSRYCPAGGLNATRAETDIIQPPQSPAANETTNLADSVVDIEAYSTPRTPQGHATNDEANSPGSSQSSAAEDNDVQGDADQRDTGPRSRLPTLSLADMARLPSKIQELEAQGCAQHISVPHVDVELEDVKKCIDKGDWRCTTCEYKVDRKGEGYVSIYADVPKDQPLIDWPGFSAQFNRPTTDEAKAVFENTVQNPPEGKIPYYIGHADILSEQPLDPGPLITGNPDFIDIHTNYQHIGGHRSGNRIHWEDFTHLDETDEGPVWRGLRSFNQVYFGTGYKLWLVIAKHHIIKFDAFVRTTWQCRECIGGISHKCLLLAPSSLEKAGIDFHIYVVGRGEAVWTLPGQQHSIINVGHCAARSMNFLYPGESIDFKKLAHCLDCDQHPLSIQYGIPLVSTEPDRKRKQQAHSHLPLKKTRNETAPQRELVKIKEALQAANLTYRPIAIDHENPSVAEVNVYKLAAAVRSTLAIEQFIEVVRQCRDPEIKTQLIQARSSLEGAVELMKAADDHTMAPKLRVRLGQLNLSQQAEKEKPGYRKNHKGGFLDEFAAKHGLIRTRLKHHLQEGKKWTSVCTLHDGLLPFIFLKSEKALGITKEDWVTATPEENNKAFHKLLDDNYTKNLCIAGKALERLLFGESVKFLWEKNGLDPDAHNIDELLKEYEMEEASAAPTDHGARGAMA